MFPVISISFIHRLVFAFLNREKSREYERKLREAIDKRDAMQQRIDEKEESFEARLRSKVDEWKAEWDEVEEGLRSEIRKLKNEVSNVILEKKEEERDE
ncbi:hypothetical protein E2C01_094776 [Portunus trituberculatus]|uniref:Uncharacterized protein n=1 Tax=Portunus trituberculatus TaxID=210409 RepID=A0A5B7JYJ3_PORTR|nr:hypothetical protein [Portunus trituberculatus]